MGKAVWCAFLKIRFPKEYSGKFKEYCKSKGSEPWPATFKEHKAILKAQQEKKREEKIKEQEKKEKELMEKSLEDDEPVNKPKLGFRKQVKRRKPRPSQRKRKSRRGKRRGRKLRRRRRSRRKRRKPTET